MDGEDMVTLKSKIMQAAEAVSASAVCSLSDTWKVWDRLGISVQERIALSEEFLGSLKERSHVFQTAQEKKLRNAEAFLRAVNAEISELRAALLEAGVGVDPMEREVLCGDGEELLSKLSKAQTVLDGLNDKEADIRVEFDALLEREEELCAVLQRPRTILAGRRIPLMQDRKDLRNAVRMLEDEKRSRSLKFEAAREAVRSMLCELGDDPATDSEKAVLDGKDHLFPDAVRKAEVVVEKLRNVAQERRLKICDLRLKVAKLWDRFRVAETFRQEFLRANDGITSAVLERWGRELENREKDRYVRRDVYVAALHGEARSLMDKLMYGPTMMADFENSIASGGEADLILALEDKVSRLEQEYVARKDLLTKFATWRSRVDDWNSCQEARNTQNFYKNRGGEMSVVAEKEKLCLKHIPRDTAALLEAVARWESAHCKAFLVHDVPISELVDKDPKLASFNQALERHATVRKPKFGSSAVKTHAGVIPSASVNTTTKANKRPLNDATSDHEIAKRPKELSAIRKIASASKIPRIAPDPQKPSIACPTLESTEEEPEDSPASASENFCEFVRDLEQMPRSDPSTNPPLTSTLLEEANNDGKFDGSYVTRRRRKC